MQVQMLADMLCREPMFENIALKLGFLDLLVAEHMVDDLDRRVGGDVVVGVAVGTTLRARRSTLDSQSSLEGIHSLSRLASWVVLFVYDPSCKKKLLVFCRMSVEHCRRSSCEIFQVEALRQRWTKKLHLADVWTQYEDLVAAHGCGLAAHRNLPCVMCEHQARSFRLRGA